jgi:hypothetical protein
MSELKLRPLNELSSDLEQLASNPQRSKDPPFTS